MINTIGSVALVTGAALLAVIRSSVPALTPAHQPGISSAAWFAGCWERRAGALFTEEQWMSPRGGTMLGMSRTIREGKVAEYEYVRLFERGEKLVYQAMPPGQPPTEFTSTTVTEMLIVFENPAHDFPQRIIYRRQGSDSLIARIEGSTPGGQKGFDYRYARANCSS
jgi:hypothetical protein